MCYFKTNRLQSGSPSFDCQPWSSSRVHKGRWPPVLSVVSGQCEVAECCGKELAVPSSTNQGLLPSLLPSVSPSFLPSCAHSLSSQSSVAVYPSCTLGLIIFPSLPHCASYALAAVFPLLSFSARFAALIGTNQFSKSLIETKTSEERIAFPNSSAGFFFTDWRSWGALKTHSELNLCLCLNFLHKTRTRR